MELGKVTDHSGRIQTDDLDWNLGRQTGLTNEERFILTYFSDIESQTIVYLRELLHTTAVEEADTIGFLSTWNYEEYFHGQALAKLLEVCGNPLEKERIAEVRRRASVSESLKNLAGWLLSRAFRREFPALFMTWGAINEMTTLRGYESLEARTQNPILKILCERIAKQERRHLAWYFNSARERLERSPTARRLTHILLRRTWSPVGVGVKTWEEAHQLIQYLFPVGKTQELISEVDDKISTLPGLAGTRPMSAYWRRKGISPLH